MLAVHARRYRWSLQVFILEVNPDLILTASPHNIFLNQVRFDSRDQAISDVAAEAGTQFPGPEQILRKTSDGDYNEVVFLGSLGQRRIRARAIFIQAHRGKPLVSASDLKLLKKVSARTNLPVVLIEY